MKSIVRKEIDILDDLKEKYGEKVDKKYSSISIAHINKRVFLKYEIISFKPNLFEIICKYTDLSFIVDEYKRNEVLVKPYFSPYHSIKKNAEKFINEFGEESIYSTTEIFYHKLQNQ